MRACAPPEDGAEGEETPPGATVGEDAPPLLIGEDGIQPRRFHVLCRPLIGGVGHFGVVGHGLFVQRPLQFVIAVLRGHVFVDGSSVLFALPSACRFAFLDVGLIGLSLRGRCGARVLVRGVRRNQRRSHGCRGHRGKCPDHQKWSIMPGTP